VKSPHRLLVLVALASFALALVSCGGSSDKESGGESHGEGGERTGEEAEQGQSEALNKIPEGDRTAFFQLATAIGTLRARAAPVAVGTSPQLENAAPLRAARAQVAKLRPADPQLVQLRAQLLPLLARFTKAPESGAGATRAAKAAIADADRIEAGLRAYTQRTPAIGGAIPD
jgi:hypothetical protein